MKPSPVSSSNEPTGDIISNIDDCMLHQFILCKTKGEFSVLATDSDLIPMERLIEAWHSINDQFTDLLRDKEQEGLEKISKDIVFLKSKVNAINACVGRLSILHSDEIVLELKKWIHIPESLNPSDAELYIKELENIQGRTLEIEVDIRHAETDLNQRLPEEMAASADIDYYERLIMQVSKHMKYPVNKFKTSVRQFAIMLVDLIMTSKALENQYKSAT